MMGQANPQLENGYTRISNELLEAICRCDFNGSQMRVLMLFIRASYGYGKKEASFPVEYIQRQTGLSERNARRAVNSLVAGGVLIVQEGAARGKARILKLNKAYTGWEAFPPDKNGRTELAAQSGDGRTELAAQSGNGRTELAAQSGNERTELAAQTGNGRIKMAGWADKNGRNGRTELTAHKENKKKIKKDSPRARACTCGEGISGSCPTPALEEIIAYCQGARLRHVDAWRFFRHYEENGWMSGGHPVEDWKKLLRKWDRQDRLGHARGAGRAQPARQQATGFTNFAQRDYDFDELERMLLESQACPPEGGHPDGGG